MSNPPEPDGWMQRFRRRCKRFTSRQIRRSQLREIKRLTDPRRAPRYAPQETYCRLATYLPPAEPDRRRVLECGCGPGKFAGLLHAMGYDVVAVDPYSFPEWDLLREKTAVSFTAEVCAEDLPFEDGSFDHVVCLGALLYFEDPAKALREMRRVMKPGGMLVVRTANRECRFTQNTGRMPVSTARNFYTMEELIEAVTEAGFEVVDHYWHGYSPASRPMLWWYLYQVWLPAWYVERLSRKMPERQRGGLILAASRSAKE